MNEKPLTLRDHEVRQVLTTGECLVVRPVKPQPAWNAELEMWVWPNALHGYASCYPTDGLIDWLTEHSPYPIGSRWWVRETWCMTGAGCVLHKADHKTEQPYWATLKWNAAITMPRWASRLTVEVVETTVEQQDGVWVWSTRARRVQ